MADDRNIVEHDILVVRRHPTNQQYIKVPFDKKNGTAAKAAYLPPVEQKPSNDGYRTTVGFACAETQWQDVGEQEPRGPALATIPLHPEPTASSSCTCYLINPENVTYETSWTTEEWSDQEVHPSDRPIVTKDVFEILVASPGGKVYLVSKSVDDATPPSATPISLKLEPEVWTSLRRGTVAGSVLLTATDGGTRVVPLVNVQALMPSINRE